MKSSTKYLKITINLLIAIGIILCCIFVLPKIFIFFMPFIIAWVIAMIANPLVRFLEKKLKIVRRAGSVVVIFLVLGGIILAAYFVISRLVSELIGFIHAFPEMWNSLEADFKEIGEKFAGFYETLPKALQFSWSDFEAAITTHTSTLIESMGEPTVIAAGNFAKNIPLVIIGIVFCILSAYFFIAEREKILEAGRSYIPLNIKEKWQLVRKTLTQAVGGYFKAQFKIMSVVFLIVLVGLSLLRINYAVLFALLIAALDFLPFFGTGAVMFPWAVIKFLSGDYYIAIGLVVIWGVSQLVRQLIQPKIMGDSMGMSPIPTLLLLYVGFKVGGAIGLLIAIPVGMILVNLYKAGVFDTTVRSIGILITDLNQFRKLEDSSDETEK